MIRWKEVLDMDEVIKQIEEEPKKKRRTAEEIAADKKAREEQLNKDAEKARNDIEEINRQMEELKKRMTEAKRKLQSNRNSIRTNRAMKLYGDLIASLGFDELEKSCVTEADFDNLSDMVKKHVRKLVKVSKNISD